MKNKIYIDIDTDRSVPIMIGKPPEMSEPSSPEEVSNMIKSDISDITDALCSIIRMADINGYFSKQVLSQACIDKLTILFNENNNESEEKA